MNLLDKANIITTPTAYSEGKLHSVKPEIALGPELVVNGDFATDSDWTKGTGWSIGGGVAVKSSGTSSILFQSNIVESSKSYKLTFDVIRNSGFITSVFLGGVSDSTDIDESGSYTYYITSINQDVLGFNADSTFNGSIDNVSVKEDISADFDFTRGSSATRVGEDGYIQDVQIIGGELVQNGDFEEIGSELITNGDFATDSDWAKGTGWTISGGKANANTTGDFINLYQNSIFIVGKTYKTTFTITDYTQGSIRLTQSGYDVSGFQNAVGTYTAYFTASQTALYMQGYQSFIGSIDNVSVKEVGQNWSFGTGWSMGDGVVVGTSVSAQFMQQPFTFVSGKKYRTTCTITGTDTLTNNVSFRLPYDGNVANITYATKGVDGVYTHEFVSTGGSNLYFGRIDTGTFTGTVDNVSVKEVTDDTNLPRINYENGIGHLLLEPQRTNLFTYSEAFDNAYWTKSLGTITANATTAPDGTLTADLFTKTSGVNTVSQVGRGAVYTTTGAHTFSIYIKPNVGNNVLLRLDSAGNSANFDFNFTTKTFANTGANAISSSFDELPNGWFRLKVTGNVTSTGWSLSACNFYYNPTNDSMYLWGAQLEVGSYPTSYIVSNSGSATTRLAETCNNAGNSDIIPSDEGVLYAEIAALANDGTFRLIGVSDGTTTNRLYIGYRSSLNQIQCAVSVGGVEQTNMFDTISDVQSFVKVAIKYKTNDFALWINGVEVLTDTSGITFPANTLNTLTFEAALVHLHSTAKQEW
jgi:hypothetical protein